jgi:hypothetical protein
MEESNDTSSSVQLLIVIRGKTESLELVEELGSFKVCMVQQQGKICVCVKP